MTRYREPEVVQIARLTMERLRMGYREADPFERDAWQMAQHIIAENDRRALASWIGSDRVLTFELRLSEIDVVLSRDPGSLVDNLIEQARRALMIKIEMRRDAGRIAAAIQKSEESPRG